MPKQTSIQKLIYKLPSKRLRQAKWNLTLPFSSAMKNGTDIVALSDSQLLRWICELNGQEDFDKKAARLKKEIHIIKKQPNQIENQNKLKKLYQKLYALQYQKDYLCLIMESDKDYDRANQGFTINGYRYHRLLGTNNGIKKSTITYIGENVYKKIVTRIDNGRDKGKPVIPAKLEAYQALVCSASIPVPMPRIAVVPDCRVSFRENVIKISDSDGDEPVLTYEKDYQIEYCDSDGYGLMSPDYSRIINRALNGGDGPGQTISGVNIRYAWTKGMLFTFDFLEFARQLNHGNLRFQDVWGTWRTISDYDVILTASMVKLWDSYDNLEQFLTCSDENHYQFSVTKAMPHQLEHVRNANYQFLQTYELSDKELYELCSPTIQEIQDVLGNDWRKTIVFAKGVSLSDDKIDNMDDDMIKALMIDRRLLNDSFVRDKIYNMLKKRMEIATKGSIKLSGNFSMVSGDLYALAQSIFGLPVTGLLKKGEVYQKYWIDKTVKEIALFRAPMTCHNNIRRRTVVHTEEMDFWYQYNTTGIILNAWDTTCDATNGSDKDGDMFFTTDHHILLSHTRNALTIECVQRKAPKIIPSEQDMVQANKLAFGDEIGSTTNHITSMLELQSSFDKNSEEYKTLDYRIKCGQHFQQNSIDKAKGILARPMPDYWYSHSACQKLPEFTEEERHFKELCFRIVAQRKPYFMRYIYPDLNAKYKKYLKDANSKCIREFQQPLEELIKKSTKTLSETEFLDYYKKFLPVGDHPCTVNRIAWLMEDALKHDLKKPPDRDRQTFDFSILKSGVAYSKKDYQKIAKIKTDYDHCVKAYQKLAHRQRLDQEEVRRNKMLMLMDYQSKCEIVCPNEKELCDILIDLCYASTGSKQFVWDLCGEIIIKNLLEKNNYLIHYPALVPSQGEFEYGGEQFVMKVRKIK